MITLLNLEFITLSVYTAWLRIFLLDVKLEFDMYNCSVPIAYTNPLVYLVLSKLLLLIVTLSPLLQNIALPIPVEVSYNPLLVKLQLSTTTVPLVRIAAPASPAILFSKLLLYISKVASALFIAPPREDRKS